MKPAPPFELRDQYGTNRRLADFAGRWLVLYFYPKDDTPGCTTEACNFRDGRDAVEAAGANVVGISSDSVKSHWQFTDKYGLNFPLLSDESGDTIKAYGAKGALGTKRSTVLIDPRGNIAKEYLGVDPASHAEDVLADLRLLKQ